MMVIQNLPHFLRSRHFHAQEEGKSHPIDNTVNHISMVYYRTNTVRRVTSLYDVHKSNRDLSLSSQNQ
jgi:hypothetical protein